MSSTSILVQVQVSLCKYKYPCASTSILVQVQVSLCKYKYPCASTSTNTLYLKSTKSTSKCTCILALV